MNNARLQAGELKFPPVRLAVTPRMLAQFAELTGDHSSLHTDAAFARKSLYRGGVAHGMLPLMFLAVLPLPEPGNLRWDRLTAAFAKAVYPGETFILNAMHSDGAVTADSFGLEYEIAREPSGVVVTHGTAALRRDTLSPCALRPRPEMAGALLRRPLSERDAWFEQIPPGDTREFEFAISQAACGALSDLLAAGLGSPPPMLLDPANLLAASLFSTLVGMCQPGRQGTFLNLEANFHRALEPGSTYRLRGKVAFKSASTMTVSSHLVISADGNDSILVSGKTHAHINTPPVMMPSIQTLRDTALDPGLRDKVVLITGASRGLGQTTARLFALHGSKVAVNYLSSSADAEKVVGEIRAAGGCALAVKADVTQRSQVQDMVRAIIEEWARIDVLVNNAVADFQSISFLELTWEQMESDLAVILEGAFHCCQAVLPHMIRQGGGKIINLSTIAVEYPPPGQAKYVAAKSALVGLTRSLAVEFARQNIQVNLVVPGMVETDLTKHVPKVVVNKLKVETPQNRLAQPAEVAKAIVFLASSQASFTTGQKLMVTGGAPPLF